MGNSADKKKESLLQNLIPGLPDDIAVDCLARVPLQFHSDMKLVCQGWHNLVSNPCFYQQRVRFKTAEHLVFLVQTIPTTTKSSKTVTDTVIQSHTETNTTHDLKAEEDNSPPPPPPQREVQTPTLCRLGVSIYNATKDSWLRMNLRNLTIPLFCHCVTVPSSNKLLLLGGWEPTTLDPVPYLYIVDLINGVCKRGAPMSEPRSFFGCAVVGASTVYVAGGHDNQKNALRSVEVYDVAADEWRMLPPMEEERDECQVLALDGEDRFLVVSGYGTDNQGKFRSDAEYYDPTTGCWSKLDGVWPYENISPRGGTTTVINTINGGGSSCQWWWLLGVNQGQQQQQQNGGVKEFDEKEQKWKVVNSIPLPNNIIGKSPPCVCNFGAKSDDYNADKVFVMKGGEEYDDGQRAFIVERDKKTGSIKWNHVGIPVGFSGFPYSASYLLV